MPLNTCSHRGFWTTARYFFEILKNMLIHFYASVFLIFSIYIYKMLKIILGETFGSFFFMSVLLATTTKGQIEVLAPLLIGLALTVSIYFTSKSSLGAMNPIASLVLYLRGDIELVKLGVYIVAEIIGAMLAFGWWKMTLGSKSK